MRIGRSGHAPSTGAGVESAEARKQLAKLYSDIDAATLDLLFASEAAGWKAKHLTPADMAKEIAFVKLGDAPIPGLDTVNPAAMIYLDPR
jgi:hypothetical protein